MLRLWISSTVFYTRGKNQDYDCKCSCFVQPNIHTLVTYIVMVILIVSCYFPSLEQFAMRLFSWSKVGTEHNLYLFRVFYASFVYFSNMFNRFKSFPVPCRPFAVCSLKANGISVHKLLI